MRRTRLPALAVVSVAKAVVATALGALAFAVPALAVEALVFPASAHAQSKAPRTAQASPPAPSAPAPTSDPASVSPSASPDAGAPEPSSAGVSAAAPATPTSSDAAGSSGAAAGGGGASGDEPAKAGSSGRHEPIGPTPRDARPAQDASTGHFEFGSYGRVSIASDLRGGTGRPADIVAYGSRLDEQSYSEFELRREDTFRDDIKTRVVTTLALFPEFFHFNGKPMQNIGVRNLYVQGSYKDLTLWAGSRMYRGDDIYLLNWWPLDNQNTMGGGGILKLGADTVVAAHAGMQRLENASQFQQIPAVAPYGFGTVPVTTLDRPRTIETLKVTHFFRNSAERHPFASDKQGFKAILYGEAHQIAAGVRREENPISRTGYPSDSGYLVGTQLAYWTGDRDTFVSLFLRHARGLAAYDPLASPLTYANDRTTSGASENLIAVSGNWEKEWFGIMAAGYLRFFRDGSAAATSREKYDEGILLARPQVYIGEHWGVGVEGSYQQRRYAILNQDKNENLSASLLRGAINPYFSPTGRGSFKRPQIGLVYAVTARDSVARSLYAAEDIFSQRKTEHFFGILAEWWFNFSSYP